MAIPHVVAVNRVSGLPQSDAVLPDTLTAGARRCDRLILVLGALQTNDANANPQANPNTAANTSKWNDISGGSSPWDFVRSSARWSQSVAGVQRSLTLSAYATRMAADILPVTVNQFHPPWDQAFGYLLEATCVVLRPSNSVDAFAQSLAVSPASVQPDASSISAPADSAVLQVNFLAGFGSAFTTLNTANGFSVNDASSGSWRVASRSVVSAGTVNGARYNADIGTADAQAAVGLLVAMGTDDSNSGCRPRRGPGLMR